MAFKPNPNKEALLKKVRTLQRRETKLLNQIEELKREGLNFARLVAAEYAKLKERIVELELRQTERILLKSVEADETPHPHSGAALDDELERRAVEYGYRADENGITGTTKKRRLPPTPAFPWETK